MKTKIIIVCSLLVLLIAFATWEEIFIKNSLEKISNMASIIITEIENNNNEINDNINEKIKELDEVWEKTEYTFCYLTNHNDMKEIGDSICYAKTYAKQKDSDGVVERINLVIYYAKCYSRIFSFDIQNII